MLGNGPMVAEQSLKAVFPSQVHTFDVVIENGKDTSRFPADVHIPFPEQEFGH